MILHNISIQPHQIETYQELLISGSEKLAGFPLLSIDTDSYIVQAEIQSGLDFDPAGGRHCIAVGKGCSLADGITFMIDMNHDYGSVVQGELSFLQGTQKQQKSRRKGTIILQNDVWVGHGATIMPGVTLHNGCVIATDAVVTKDVPPYAIAGGNPAEVLRCRFDAQTIDGLQRIAWWDWPKEVLLKRRQDFSLPPPKFVEKYLADDLGKCHFTHPRMPGIKTVLFVPDLSSPFPLFHKVLQQYFSEDQPGTELLLYLPQEISAEKDLNTIRAILKKYQERNTAVILQSGEDLPEPMLFQWADYFVTTRDKDTVRRTCLADLYDTEVLYGTDEPIFPSNLI